MVVVDVHPTAEEGYVAVEAGKVGYMAVEEQEHTVAAEHMAAPADRLVDHNLERNSGVSEERGDAVEQDELELAHDATAVAADSLLGEAEEEALHMELQAVAHREAAVRGSRRQEEVQQQQSHDIHLGPQRADARRDSGYYDRRAADGAVDAVDTLDHIAGSPPTVLRE